MSWDIFDIKGRRAMRQARAQYEIARLEAMRDENRRRLEELTPRGCHLCDMRIPPSESLQGRTGPAA